MHLAFPVLLADDIDPSIALVLEFIALPANFFEECTTDKRKFHCRYGTATGITGFAVNVAVTLIGPGPLTVQVVADPEQEPPPQAVNE